MAEAVRLFTLLSIVLGVTGCVFLPPRPSGKVPMMATEMEHVVTELGCNAVRMPPKEFPAQPQHFGCIGGAWDMISLTYEHGEKDPDKLGLITLRWKEWKEGAHVADERKDVVRFLAYLAARFLPESRQKDLVDVFFGKRDGNLITAEYTITYKRRDMGMAYDNKMVFTPRNPHFLSHLNFMEQP